MQIPICTRPCLKQPAVINISCNKTSINQETVETFLPPLSRWKSSFSFFRMLVCVMSFSGRPSWKNGDKTSCNNGPKEKPASLFFFFCLELVIVWTNRGQIRWKSKKSIEIHKQFGTAAHTYPPFTNLSFMYVLLGTVLHRRPPPAAALPPPWTHSTDRQSGWEQHITVPRCSLPHHFHYIVILNYQQRWTGKDDWHIPASGAATAWLSSVSWQAPLYAVPDGRGLAKCLAKGLH